MLSATNERSPDLCNSCGGPKGRDTACNFCSKLSMKYEVGFCYSAGPNNSFEVMADGIKLNGHVFIPYERLPHVPK
jgi:hypothetical protein